jgi:hypothetical protein
VTAPETWAWWTIRHQSHRLDVRRQRGGQRHRQGEGPPAGCRFRFTSQHGKGVVVRDRKHMVYRPQAERDPRISEEMDRFMSYLAKEGRQPSQTIDVSVVSAPPLVAQRLEIEPDSLVVVRKRVRSLDGDFFNINDTYYPYELAQAPRS